MTRRPRSNPAPTLAKTTLRLLLVVPLLLLGGCPGPDERPPDGGLPLTDAGADAGGDAGTGSSDAGETDAGSDPDAGNSSGDEDGGTDGGSTLPAPGFGDITGTCGVLDTELTSPAPDYFVNRIDFGMDPYDDSDFGLLTAGGQEMINDGNAGGSSLLSEVFSFELLARCEGAKLLKTETEVVYTTPGTITDLLVEIDGMKVGVSVTRAVAFPFEDPYSVAQAKELLEKKLKGILASSENVAPEDKWVKQILYVIAYADGHAASLEAAFQQIDPSIRADTIVMVSISDGDDAFIY